MEDKLNIYWQEPTSRERIHIAELYKTNEGFLFKYANNREKMDAAKFLPIFPFLDLESEYTSATMFPAFLSRLPDPKRVDIKQILDKYALTAYDEFELLKKSEGRIPFDNLEFIEPISFEDNYCEKEFYIAGIRHGDFCNGNCCNDVMSLSIGTNLDLVIESENAYDKNAVTIMINSHKVGYVPVYYSEAVHKALCSNKKISCHILCISTIELVVANQCRECIKAKLIIKNQ